MNVCTKYWVNTIHPLWLTLCMEAVLNVCLPIRVFEEDGLRQKVLKTQFFIDNPERLAKDFSKAVQRKCEVQFLRRCLELFKLLEVGKSERVIDEDPPIFRPNSNFPAGQKTLTNFLVSWATMFLGKESNIKKHLLKLNYSLDYEQRSIHEVDLHITNLCVDLKDGVRLAKYFEILQENVDVIQHLRYNPGGKTQVSKMTREHNWKLVLKVCQKLEVDTSFRFNDDQDRKITNNELAIGHREQTLCLIIRLMRFYRDKFTYPKLEILKKIENLLEIYLLQSPTSVKIYVEKMKNDRIQAAITIQKFWRNSRLDRYKKPATLRKISLLQRNFRCVLAKKQLAALKYQQTVEISVLKIQCAVRQYLARKKLVTLRREKFKISAVLFLQRQARKIIAVRKFEQRKRERLENQAAILLQTQFRKILAMRQLEYLKQQKMRLESAICLQSHFRRFQAIQQLKFLKLEKAKLQATVTIQSYFRRYLAMQELKNLKEAQARLQAAITIQSYWRWF